MIINKKLLVTLSLLSAVVFASTTAMKQDEEHKFKNLKVLPKNITDKQLDDVMEEWEHSLGVKCSFCHVRNEETKKMDWANDAKPEKAMAREMYKMTATINKKYFKAGKDSLGMVINTGVNCNTCHKGTAHPEVVKPEHKRGSRPPQPPAAAPAPAPGQ